MYDLHSHLLPGIDDGPASLEEALALARALVDDGVSLVAATPHGFGSGMVRSSDCSHWRQLLQELRERVQAAALPLQIILGNELYLLPNLPERLQGGQALPYEGSRTVLLEAPSDRLTPGLERAIFELQVAGYRVLLAHPERTREVQEHPERLRPLVDKGVYVQLTAASLTGDHGARSRLAAETLLLAGMCHVLASDAHAASGRRAPCLRRGRDSAALLVGASAAGALVEANPAALLSGAPVPPLQLEPRPQPKRRRWF